MPLSVGPAALKIGSSVAAGGLVFMSQAAAASGDIVATWAPGGGVLAAMILAWRITRSAERDAMTRYKATAAEADTALVAERVRHQVERERLESLIADLRSGRQQLGDGNDD
jgi:hypothetical protein